MLVPGRRVPLNHARPRASEESTLSSRLGATQERTALVLAVFQEQEEREDAGAISQDKERIWNFTGNTKWNLAIMVGYSLGTSSLIL